MRPGSARATAPAEESPVFKLIIVGDSAVGKSCILLRFDENRFQPIHDVTVGCTFVLKEIVVDGRSVRLQCWDTAGQEVFRSITRSYYRDAACAMIVYDVTAERTFAKVEEWVNEVRGIAPPDCIIIVIGNKIDLEDARHVDVERGKAIAERLGTFFFETSAATGVGVEAAFKAAAAAVCEARVRTGNPVRLAPVGGDHSSWAGCKC